MNYPIRILPNTNNKIISCDLSSHYLVRYTNTNVIEDIIDNVTGFIKQEHVCSPRDNAQDLSTSLLGVFEIPYTKIELTAIGTQKFIDYCEPDTTVDVPIYDEDFILNNNRHYWTLLIGNIDKQNISYEKSNNPFVARCLVCHTPTKWNFWHFSIRWFLISENCMWHELPENEKKKRWAARLAFEARVAIAKYGKVLEPNYSELPTECYTKAS